MPILIFVSFPLLVHLRLRRLFVGLHELLFGSDFLQVEVLVFFVSSRDTEVLGDQGVIGFLSAVRKPLGFSQTFGFASINLPGYESEDPTRTCPLNL